MTGLETGAFGAIGLLAAAIVSVMVVLYLVPVSLWMAAWASGAYVGSSRLSGCGSGQSRRGPL